MAWPTVTSPGMHSFGAGLYYANYGTAIGASLTLGVAIEVEDASWTEIGRLVNVTAPERTVGDTKITHTKSPRKAHEYVPGWVEGGTATLRLIYSKATMAALETLGPAESGSDDPVAGEWRRKEFLIQYPDGAVSYWTGYVKSKPVTVPGADSDDPVAIDVTIKVSGDVRFSS
jgi:hypothetical protein